MKVQKVKRAYEQVAVQIRDLILKGELKPGDRLPSEEELARTFGVGRPTIREAIKILVSANILKSIPGAQGGTFVDNLDIQNLSQNFKEIIELLFYAQNINMRKIVEARFFSEIECAGMAALRRSGEELQVLHDILKRDNHHDDVKRMKQFKHNSRFHEQIARMAHNPIMEMTVFSVYSFLQDFIKEDVPIDEETQLRVQQEHQSLYEAICKGDVQNAKLIMRKHLSFLESNLYFKE